MKGLANILRDLDRLKAGEADNLNVETLDLLSRQLSDAAAVVDQAIYDQRDAFIPPPIPTIANDD